MSQVFCHKCGSVNHYARDCSAPDQRLAPPPEPVRDRSETRQAAPDGGGGCNRSGQDAETRLAVCQGAETGMPEAGLEPPRWPGGPQICNAANRPALESEKAVKGYVDRWCPKCVVERVWKCGSCGLWHFAGHMPPPSQDGHRAPLPKGFVPFRRKAMRESAFVGGQAELPKREVAAAERKPEPRRAPPPRKVAGQTALF